MLSMINPIQTTALIVLSGGVLTLASLVSGNVAEAAPGYSTFHKSEVQQVIENQNAAQAKGRAAHQSIQSGGSASPKKMDTARCPLKRRRPIRPVSEASNPVAIQETCLVS